MMSWQKAFLGAVLAVLPLPGAAGITLTGTLGETARATLPYDLAGLAAGDGAVFAYGTDADGAHRLLRLSPESLAVEAEATLPGAPASILVRSGGREVAVLSGGEDGAELSLYDRDLALLGVLPSPLPLDDASLTSVDGNRIVAAGRPRDDGTTAAVMVDISDPAAPRLAEPLPVPSFGGGADRAWFSPALNIVFVNLAAETALLAVDRKSGRLINDLRFYTKSPRPVSFRVLSFLPDQPCRQGRPPTYLIADPQRGQLMLAGFDERFQSLDVLSEVRLAVAGVPEAGGRPLLGASCDTSVVWSGQGGGREIVQFSAPDQTQLLEQVGTITLPAPLRALAVSEDGSSALAAVGSGTLLRFEAAPSSEARVIGSEEVREFQRLLSVRGYQVGAIDGLIGPATERAASELNERTGLEIDLRGGLEEAITILRGARQ